MPLRREPLVDGNFRLFRRSNFPREIKIAERSIFVPRSRPVLVADIMHGLVPLFLCDRLRGRIQGEENLYKLLNGGSSFNGISEKRGYHGVPGRLSICPFHSAASQMRLAWLLRCISPGFEASSSEHTCLCAQRHTLVLYSREILRFQVYSPALSSRKTFPRPPCRANSRRNCDASSLFHVLRAS